MTFSSVFKQNIKGHDEFTWRLNLAAAPPPFLFGFMKWKLLKVLNKCFYLDVFLFLQASGGVRVQLEKEVLHYDYHASFFDIFVRLFSHFNIQLMNWNNNKALHVYVRCWRCSGSQLSSWPTPSVSCVTGGPSQWVLPSVCQPDGTLCVDSLQLKEKLPDFTAGISCWCLSSDL